MGQSKIIFDWKLLFLSTAYRNYSQNGQPSVTLFHETMSRVHKLFTCSIQLSRKFQQLTKTEILKNKQFSGLRTLRSVFILLKDGNMQLVAFKRLSLHKSRAASF